MGSVTSEEGSEERSSSYNMSADVSESETSSCDEDEVYTGSTVYSPSATDDSSKLNPRFSFPAFDRKDVVVWDDKPQKSEIELMKERFAKLLLGEDMSGGGRGVCPALAISNAITNLSATIFGELWRLEPLAPQKKEMWCREMKCLLSVCDSIVELVPSTQKFPGAGNCEVMATRPRLDLYINLPALKKLDGLLLGVLDGFRSTEFWYVSQGIGVDDYDKYSSGVWGGRPSVRQEEKWWLPCPKVPGKGLSEDSRKMLQQSRDCTNQIYKAAMTINNNVLAEMEIPSAYLETLPKNGRGCLGDVVYREITADHLSPERLFEYLDLSSEHQMLDVVNRIEAAVHVWKLKEQKKHTNTQTSKRNLWGGKARRLGDVEKNQSLVQRAEALLQNLRLQFPSLPQTALDMNKIQFNKDVGHAILESYSRVTESLAFNIIARIDDVLYVDDAVKQCAAVESASIFKRGGLNGIPIQKKLSPSPFSIQHTPYASPFATPMFSSSPPLPASPRSVSPFGKSKVSGLSSHKLIVPADLDKLWSYAGSLGPKNVHGNAPERD